MLPERLLYANDSDVKVVSLPRADGISHDNQLLFNVSELICTKLLNADGILPDRKLLCRDSDVKRVSLPRSDGIR